MSYHPTFSTCRLCRKSGTNLIKYEVRHYAHADCALKKWGAAFFDRLKDWQIEAFPYFAAQRAGLDGELVRRFDKIRARAEAKGQS